MSTFSTFHPCKAIVQDAAIKIAIDNLSHIGPEKAILLGKTLVIDLLKRLEMVFNTLIILRFLWLSRAIYRRDVGHERFSFGSKSRMPDEIYCKFN